MKLAAPVTAGNRRDAMRKRQREGPGECSSEETRRNPHGEG